MAEPFARLRQRFGRAAGVRAALGLRSTLLVSALVLAAGAALAPGCLERHEPAAQTTEDRCTGCHGEAQRPGDFVLKSAPPYDLLGTTDPSYPGVGAHAVHLSDGPAHRALACSECHSVPERVDSPGHADDPRPAELVFGDIASARGHTPRYDASARACFDSYCHGAESPLWTDVLGSERACGTCHGLPPPPPHPASARCSVCHGSVVDEQRRFVAPELHVNGTVESSAGDCSRCHGDTESPAPPADTLGNRDTAFLGVGAHRAHLEGGAFGRPLACGECHDVPSMLNVFEHVGPLPAEVRLRGVGEAGGREPHWDRESATCKDGWCHAPGPSGVAASPSWVASEPLACDGCHGLPPPAPHPVHDACASCHGDVVDDSGAITDRMRHADGVVDIALPDCTTCHGDGDDPAPPRDLSGSRDSERSGVGAHRTHVEGTSRSRPVACRECHLVPERVLDPGHIDTALPAEIVFSGAAEAFGGTARYEDGRCTNTACHGGAFPDANDSGGENTAPRWTRVNEGEAECGSCHGLPPPRPHPLGDLNPTCSACHENIAPDNRTFVRPELHVDGIVTFTLP